MINVYPLYIDPGTGSALFSIAIGIAATLYFLGRGLFLKFGVLFFGKRKNENQNFKYVIFAEEKRYYPYFENILDEFEARQIEVNYLTMSLDDPVFISRYEYVKPKYIGTGNKAYAYLNLMSASFVLATTPHLDVFQWKRSKNVKHYSHLVHGAGGTLLYRLFSLDYFDSVLVAGEVEISEIRMLEKARNIAEKQIIVAGNTFFDRCIKKIKDLPKEEEHFFTVLVSPSWGPSALLKIYGEKLLDPLSKTRWRIIIRPHPQSVINEKAMLDRLQERYKNNLNIEWDYNNENIYSLSKSDIMISDFSSIIYDFVFLFDKPVLLNINDLDFRRLDAYTVNIQPYFLESIKKTGKELNGLELDNIEQTINSISQDTQIMENRQEIKKIMWQHQGESAKRVVDFMVETTDKETC
ncbi:MAG: CDP-glycerol glycerophosphotransferase family protein [Treponema sp.]|nr:CDP-glycerol glycerophosphotransferase family protein [Treponema sp.]